MAAGRRRASDLGRRLGEGGPGDSAPEPASDGEVVPDPKVDPDALAEVISEGDDPVVLTEDVSAIPDEVPEVDPAGEAAEATANGVESEEAPA